MIIENKYPDNERVSLFFTYRKNWIWIAIIAIIFLSFYTIQGILLPFIAGIIVAYLLNPLVEYLKRYRIPRSVSAPLLILLTFFLIISFFLVTIPFLQDQIVALTRHFPNYGEKIYYALKPLLDASGHLINIQDVDQLKEKAGTYVGDVFQWSLTALGKVLGNTLALANLISSLILTPVVAFYLLRDWPAFTRGLTKLLPRDQTHTIIMQMQEIDRTLGSYLKGQCLVCLCLATVYSIGLNLTGLNYAWTIGIATGILAFVPYVGFLIGMVSAIGVAMAQFGEWSSIGSVALVFLVGLSIESYVLTPKLIGDRIGLHPLWIIFSLLVGGLLFGFAGMFLAMPVAATIGVLIRFGMKKYFQSAFYHGHL
ncbi:MAG: AI-2E family transporter [Janthinobacterium lividum]